VIEVHTDDDFLAALAAKKPVHLGLIMAHADAHRVRLPIRVAFQRIPNEHREADKEDGFRSSNGTPGVLSYQSAFTSSNFWV
jgi:hypothetical protein